MREVLVGIDSVVVPGLTMFCVMKPNSGLTNSVQMDKYLNLLTNGRHLSLHFHCASAGGHVNKRVSSTAVRPWLCDMYFWRSRTWNLELCCRGWLVSTRERFEKLHLPLDSSRTMSAQLDSDVKALLEQHEYLQVVEVGEGEQKRVRVRCDLTQHELLPRVDAIEAYLKTKKFLKAKEWYCYDYTKYEPYIVAHRRKPKSLYCNVTGIVLNRIPAEVEKHVNGKKFQRLKDHVNFSKRKDGDEEDGDFDANAFEFENQQLLYSDEEDEEDSPKQKKGSDDDEEDDEEDEDELEDDEEDDSDGEVDDDMAEFYPKEDDESEDEHIREAVKRLTMKKRKASGDEAETDGAQDQEEDAESKPTKAKKQKKGKDNPAKEKSEEPKKKVKHQPKMNAKERKKAKRAEYIKNKQTKK